MKVLIIGAVGYIETVLIDKLLRISGITNRLVLQEIFIFLRLKILSFPLSNIYGE